MNQTIGESCSKQFANDVYMQPTSSFDISTDEVALPEKDSCAMVRGYIYEKINLKYNKELAQ